MLEEIGELAKRENVLINCLFGPEGALTIVVDSGIKDYITIGWDWSEDTIIECVKETIRRAKR